MVMVLSSEELLSAELLAAEEALLDEVLFPPPQPADCERSNKRCCNPFFVFHFHSPCLF